MARHTIDLPAAKSRSDDTLLTVGFNLRLRSANPTTLSPAWDDTILMTWGEVYAALSCCLRDKTVIVMYIISQRSKVPSLRDLESRVGFLPAGYATASPTVNKILSHAGHSLKSNATMSILFPLLKDALIAATAIFHNAELFTLNRKDFAYIPNLKLYEPK